MPQAFILPHILRLLRLSSLCVLPPECVLWFISPSHSHSPTAPPSLGLVTGHCSDVCVGNPVPQTSTAAFSLPIPAWGRWHQTLSPSLLLNMLQNGTGFADSSSTLSSGQHILNRLHSRSLHPLQQTLSTFLFSSNTSQSYNPNLYREFCSLHVLKGLGPYLMNEFSCQEKQRYKNRNC